MITNFNATQKGILFALIGYSGFAISDAAVKYLTEYYSVMLIIAYVLALASLFLVLFSPLIGGIKHVQRKMIKFHILRAAMNLCASILIVYSFSILPLASVYTIIFALPFITVILAMVFYGEDVPASRWTSILLGFGGVLVAMRPSAAGINPTLMIPLAAAFFLAIMWIVTRSMQGESPFSMAFAPTFLASIISFMIAFGEFQMPMIAHLPLFTISGASIAVGFLCLSIAFHKAPSAAVSPFNYTQILWGLGFGYFIFADTPDIWTIAGASMIISSGLWMIFQESRTKKNENG